MAILRQRCSDLARQRTVEEAAAAQFHEERERLNELFVATKNDVQGVQSLCRARARDRKALQEASALNVQAMQRRIAHLLMEQSGEASGAAVAGQALAVQVRQEADRTAEAALRAGRHDLKVTLLEMEASQDEHIKALKVEQDRAQADLRADFERRLRELHAVYDDRQSRLRDEMNEAREKEVSEHPLATWWEPLVTAFASCSRPSNLRNARALLAICFDSALTRTASCSCTM